MSANVPTVERLRLAMVTSFPAEPARPHGGVEAVAVNLVPALAKHPDLDVHVVTTDRACASPAVTVWQGATIHRLPWRGRRVLTHATRTGRRDVLACLERLRPHVLHAHDFYGIMTQHLALPRVLTIHGFIHADTLRAGLRFARLRSWLWGRIERRCWRRQGHIISISPYVREHLAPIMGGRIHDIDNPIDPACFRQDRHEQADTIFTAALVCPRKNTLVLLEAFRRLRPLRPHARLRIAGAFVDRAYEGLVRRFIQRHDLTGRVDILGETPAGRVREELAAASVFALVSLEEGAPMGVAEAMAAGVPVVTSNRCGMPYMVRDGESGFLVDPTDPQDVAARLVQVLADADLRERMGRLGRRIAEDRFAPDRVAARTREVYCRAAREGGCRD